MASVGAVMSVVPVVLVMPQELRATWLGAAVVGVAMGVAAVSGPW